jgi:ADP-ribose pyrophosphatase YjhB (NUDIX family)
LGTKKKIICNKCGNSWEEWNNPVPTVDAIIEIYDKNENFKGIVLIDRKNFPFGWAIPGGFMDYGETAETTAVREALEETSLKVKIKKLLGFYSSPERDPRHHTVTATYICSASGIPKADDDAKDAKIFELDKIPEIMAFDHRKVLDDYINYKKEINENKK